MFICELTKVERPDIPGGLRTLSVLGSSANVPETGFPFMMIAEPIDKTCDVRYIETSKVTSVTSEDINIYNFTTETGSLYKLEIKKRIE